MWLVGDGDLLLIGAAGGVGRAPARRIDRGRCAQGHRGRARWPTSASRRRRRRSRCSRCSPAARASSQRFGGGGAHPDRRSHGARVLGAARHLRPDAERQRRGHPRARRASRRRRSRDAFAARDRCRWTSRGQMELKAAGVSRRRTTSFRRAATLNSRNADALSGLSDAAAGAGQAGRRARVAEARAATRAATMRPSGSSCRGCWRSPGDSTARSRRRPKRCGWRPTTRAPREQLASVLADAGDGERLAPLADAHGRAVSRSRRGAVLPRDGAVSSWDKPRTRLRPCVTWWTVAPAHARAQNLLGAACAAARPARLRAGRVRGVDPGEPARSVDLREPRAVLSCSPSNPDAAARTTSPKRSRSIRRSAAARDGLAQARAASPTELTGVRLRRTDSNSDDRFKACRSLLDAASLTDMIHA